MGAVWCVDLFCYLLLVHDLTTKTRTFVVFSKNGDLLCDHGNDNIFPNREAGSVSSFNCNHKFRQMLDVLNLTCCIQKTLM